MNDYDFENLQFEWDEEKNRKNFKKHGVRFEDAIYVFQDENRIDEYDELHSDDEDRYQVIGMVDKIFVVVYTERGDFTRIISARHATKKEVRRYDSQFYT